MDASKNGQLNLKEQFWNEHIQLKSDSLLSRAEYCRNHELNYDQFGFRE